MKRLIRATCFLALVLVMTVSCRQLYTTSIGSSFARDGLALSKSTSMSDLMDLANNPEYANSADAAKEILDVLDGKSDGAVRNLSVEDKTTVLNLASTAAIEFSTINDIFNGYDPATSNTDDLIATALSAFDTSVNMGAVETLLADPETLTNAPVDSIVMASSIILANLATDIGASVVMSAMGSLTPPVLTAEQQAQIDLVKNVLTVIDARPAADLENVSLGGFDITDLLRGTP